MDTVGSVRVVPDSASVCIADPDEAVRDAMTHLLQLHGLKVWAYSSGRALLQHGKAAQARCVLCESRMGDMRGMDVFLALRAQGIQTPFALVVGNREELRSIPGVGGLRPRILVKPVAIRWELLHFVQAPH